MTDQWRHVVVPADRIAGWIERFEARHGTSAASVDGEAVLLEAPDGHRAQLRPPFLIDGAVPDGPMPVDWLLAHVATARRVAAVLIRRGGHAVGVFDGEELVASKVGSSYVQGTTKAGGWSQQRYARRRDNQTRAAVQDAVADAVRIVLPQLTSLNAVVVGGDRPLIREALSDPRLMPLDALVAEPFLAVADPRLATLRGLPEQFRAVRVALRP